MGYCIVFILLATMMHTIATFGTRFGRSNAMGCRLPNVTTMKASTSKGSIQSIAGVRDILHKYDVFLLDQFGVLHDGVKPLPGVIEVLNELQVHCKKTVIVSNSSNRAKSAIKRYEGLGLPTTFTGFLTSGETAWEYLAQHFRGKKCLWFTWQSTYPKDQYLRSLEITPTSNVEEADFLLFHGSQCLVTSPYDVDGTSALKMQLCSTGIIDTHIQNLLQEAAKRGLPSICANMDMSAVSRNQVLHMPGHLHRYYQEQVSPQALTTAVGFGKPDPSFFQTGIHLSTRANNVSLSRVLHVGDSLHHDIAGATATGIDSLLITRHGVHRSEYAHESSGCSTAQAFLLKRTEEVCLKENTPLPTYVLPSFHL